MKLEQVVMCPCNVTGCIGDECKLFLNFLRGIMMFYEEITLFFYKIQLPQQQQR